MATLALGTVFLRAAGKTEQWTIAFETMLGSADKAKVLLKDITAFAASTPFDLPSTIEGAQRLLAYNIEAEKIIPTLTSLGNIAAGVGSDKFPRLITAYGQVRAANKLYGTELRQFTEAGVPLIDALAKQFNVTKSEVRGLVETGKVGFKDVESALLSITSGSGKFGGLMEKQSKTFLGTVTNISDDLFQLTAAIGNEMLPKAKELAEGLRKITDVSNIPKLINAYKFLELELRFVSVQAKKLFNIVIGVGDGFADTADLARVSLLKIKGFFQDNETEIKEIQIRRLKRNVDLFKRSEKLQKELLDITLDAEELKRKGVIKTAEVAIQAADDLAKEEISINEEHKKIGAETGLAILKDREDRAQKSIDIEKDYLQSVTQLRKENVNELEDLAENHSEKLIQLQKNLSEGLKSIAQQEKDFRENLLIEDEESAIEFNQRKLDRETDNGIRIEEVEETARLRREEIEISAEIKRKKLLSDTELDNVTLTNKLTELNTTKNQNIEKLDRATAATLAKLNRDFENDRTELDLDFSRSVEKNLKLREKQEKELKDKLLKEEKELNEKIDIENKENKKKRVKIEEEKQEALSKLEKTRADESRINERSLAQSIGEGTKAALSGQVDAIVASSIASATATAIAQALPTYGASLIALVGQVAGIVTAGQVAKSAISSVKFQQGGVVSGGSTSGDSQVVRANSGEMILNRSQQSNLFQQINGGGGGGGGSTINFNGGVFMGDRRQAKELAKMIDTELVTLSRQRQRVSV